MKMLFAILFASMLLLAGCPGEEQAGGAQAPSGGQPGAPAQPGMPGEAGAGEAPAGGTEQSPFESWDVQAMMATGQPVYCTMTYSEEGATMTSELYLKGEMMRADSVSVLGGETYESIVVFKNDMAYVSGTGGMEMEGMEDCDWMTLDNKKLEECMPDEEGGASFDTESYSAESYDATPDDFSCSYGTFGDEVFDTPGTVCDLSEQLCEMYESMSAGGYPGGIDASICEGMEGQEYEDCITAVSQYG